ncbi:MAG TPA: nucleoside-diphosphate sugar epimerase/dehydratase [Patescibacteria group bacterium]|nr:nucleoside-diphosphate sugar epimerase/dehydratase [Patescibacteria group bacterium]
MGRRHAVLVLLLLFDMSVVAFVPLLSLFVRFDGSVEKEFLNYAWQVENYIPVMIVICLAVFYRFNLYNRLWRYAGFNEIVNIVFAVTVSSAGIMVALYVLGANLPRSIYPLNWVFTLVLITASRIGLHVVRKLLVPKPPMEKNAKNVLVVGAGDAGVMISRELRQRYGTEKQLVGFVDDSPYKVNKYLAGAKVLGTRKDISRIIGECKVDEIIIAIPSASGIAIREIVRECKQTKCVVKTVPGIFELIDGKVSMQQLRNVDVEDLLRREPVKLDLRKITGYLAGKRVLVTGAGGSIGSELCRQIAKMSPETLILLGRGENSIYEIEGELREKKYDDLNIVSVIADIRDLGRINTVFNQLKPQVVFHAAAHKHVPLMEEQPVEAVRNNIFGTKNVAEASQSVSVERFIMISTDKAVNPTSVMGATKKIAESVVCNMNGRGKTKFAAVRFGNVLGSRGSVVPLFRKQIAKGGPITVTHPDMIRYFMSIPEAAQLVLQAGALAQGGEVFLLDMGEPVKIVDLACDLIELSGLKPHEDIKIEFTGLRAGEKLYEELLLAEEGNTATKHEKIFAADMQRYDGEKMGKILNLLKETDDSLKIIHLLAELLPSYHGSRVKRLRVLEGDGVKTVREKPAVNDVGLAVEKPVRAKELFYSDRRNNNDYGDSQERTGI